MADGSADTSRLIIAVDKTGLSCTITILPGLPAQTPTEMEIRALLEEQRIAAAAIDESAIAGLIGRARSNPDGEHAAQVAAGTPAEDGSHAGFTLCPTLQDRFDEIERRRRAILEHGEPNGESPVAAGTDGEPIDFHNLSAFVVVRAGETLGSVTAPTNGSDGVDVRGETIPAKRGRSLGVKTDYTTRIENGRMVAAVPGRLVHAIDRVAIETTLTINEDVDYHTGNIDFPGSVVVHGAVKDGFRVRATGDVQIDGLVDAATLEIDADLTLTRGMAGRDVGELVVRGDVQAGYLDDVRGRIEGDCIVANEIKECVLRVGRRVESPSCAFYGGELHADMRVELGTLGSAGGVETLVSVGANQEIDDLAAKLEDLVASIFLQRDKAASELSALNAAIKKLNASQAERLTELQFEQIRADELAGKLGEAAADLLRLFDRQARPTLVVRRKLHRGAHIRLRHVGLVIRETVTGPVTFDLDESGTPRCFLQGATEATPVGRLAKLEDTGRGDPLELLRACAVHAIAPAGGDEAVCDDSLPPAAAA